MFDLSSLTAVSINTPSFSFPLLVSPQKRFHFPPLFSFFPYGLPPPLKTVSSPPLSQSFPPDDRQLAKRACGFPSFKSSPRSHLASALSLCDTQQRLTNFSLNHLFPTFAVSSHFKFMHIYSYPPFSREARCSVYTVFVLRS